MTAASTASSRQQADGALRDLLTAIPRRARLRCALETCLRALPWAALASATAVGLARLLRLRLPAPDGAALALLAVAVLLAPPAGLALIAALRLRIDRVGAALLADRALGLQERLTTSVALGEVGSPRWSDAAQRLRGASAGDVVPWRPQRMRGLSALLLVPLAALTPACPLPADRPPEAPDPAVVAAARSVEKQAEDLARRLADTPRDGTRAVIDEVRETLRRAQLEPMTREQATAEFERLDNLARTRQEERLATRATSLERALSSIEQSTLRRKDAREASGEEAASLEKQLRDLADAFDRGVKFEPRDMKRLSMRLAEASQALEGRHDQLAGTLQELAAALERGDEKAARELARALADSSELEQMSAEAAEDQALQDARRLVRQAMASLGTAKPDGGDEPGEGPGDARGLGRDGKAKPVRDWGVGTTNEDQPATGTDFGLHQDRQSTETSDWREAYEALAASQRLDDARGRASRVSGAVGEGAFEVVATRAIASGPESAQAPLLALPPESRKAVEEALLREEIPPTRRDTVREYFTSIDRPGEAAPAPNPK